MSDATTVPRVSNSPLQPIRGTRDLLGEECRRFRHVVATGLRVASNYGFQEIETPVLESSAVFLRTLGETSDVVSKQMYLFQDRGGDEVTLRPEGTAGVARAFISEGLSQNLPLKLFYSGPMFRYERPQKGRYRQFYQFGVEILGVESVQADIELLALAWQTLKTLGVAEQTQLLLNTIGDTVSREKFREALVAYLRGHVSSLSEDSRIRLEKNPLRILDSKDEGDRKVIADAPLFSSFLNEESQKFFSSLCEGLDVLGIPYQVDSRLVRGLDYYCHTVFEFVAGNIGAQNAVLSGGRYDGLIKSMGGPATPGVGWAAGTDRLASMIAELNPQSAPIAIIPMGEKAERETLTLAYRLREAGFSVDVGYSGNMGKRMKRADRIGAKTAVIIGDNELAKNIVLLKELSTGEQKEVAMSNLTEVLRQRN